MAAAGGGVQRLLLGAVALKQFTDRSVLQIFEQFARPIEVPALDGMFQEELGENGVTQVAQLFPGEVVEAALFRAEFCECFFEELGCLQRLATLQRHVGRLQV